MTDQAIGSENHGEQRDPDSAITRSDKELLFEQILEENGLRLRTIARANANGSDSSDLEQEIMLALWKSLDSYEGRSSRRTWFYRVAANTVNNFARSWRRNGRKHPIMAAPEPASPSLGQNRDPVQLIEEFARSLGKIDQIVFLMCLDAVAYEDMAAALGLSAASLRVRVSRLKSHFARYMGI